MKVLRIVVLALVVFSVGNLVFGLILRPPGYFGLDLYDVTKTTTPHHLSVLENMGVTLTNAFTGLAFCTMFFGFMTFGAGPVLIAIGLVLAVKNGLPVALVVFLLFFAMVFAEVVGLHLWASTSI